MVRKMALLLFLLNLPCGLLAGETIQGGRYLEDDPDFGVAFQFGTLGDLSGKVEETSRLVTRRTGRSAGDRPETYDLEELGFDGTYPLFGFGLEKWWKYFTLQADLKYTQIDASETASRDFFIGVDDVDFGGQSFEYMVIPAGEKYDADMDLLIGRLAVQWTPVTLNPGGNAQFTPWLHAGLSGTYASFTVDAGRAEGITLSEFPAREYVVKGKGDGSNGGAIPEIGFGGEARFRLDKATLVFKGNYALLNFDDFETDNLGIQSRNVKKLDIDYTMIDLRAEVEWPLSDKTDLVFGLGIQMLDADAFATADEGQTDEEILAKREKFDKNITLEWTTITGMVGLRF